MSSRLFIHNYEKVYDDHDRYFDLLFDLYTDMHDYIDEHSLLVLDKDRFTDFYEFCLKNLNRSHVDEEQISERLKQIHEQIRETGETLEESLEDDDYLDEEEDH